MDSKEDDPFSLPPLVEWLTFTVEQMKSTANLFSHEVELLLSEFVNKNLSELLKEDYKSKKISEQIIEEIQTKVNKTTNKLLKLGRQADEELAERFSKRQHGNDSAGNSSSNAVKKTAAESIEESSEESEDEADVADTREITKDSEPIISQPTSPINDNVSDIMSDEELFDNQTSPVEGDCESSRDDNGSGNEETVSESDEDPTSRPGHSGDVVRIESKSEKSTSASPEKKASPHKDSTAENSRRNKGTIHTQPESEDDPLQQDNPDTENIGSPKEKEAEGSMDVFSQSDSDTPPEVSEKVNASKKASEQPNPEADPITVSDPDPLSLGLPASPPETVFLGGVKDRASPKTLKTGNKKGSSSSSVSPPSPQETVFLGSTKRRVRGKGAVDSPEDAARKLILQDLDDNDDDDKDHGDKDDGDKIQNENPSSPTETVVASSSKRDVGETVTADKEEDLARQLLLRDLDDDKGDDDEKKIKLQNPPSPTETVFLPGKKNANVNAPFKKPAPAKLELLSSSDSDQEKSRRKKNKKSSREKPNKADEKETNNKNKGKMADDKLIDKSEIIPVEDLLTKDWKIKAECQVVLAHLPTVVMDELKKQSFVLLPSTSRRRKKAANYEDILTQAIKRLDSFEPVKLMLSESDRLKQKNAGLVSRNKSKSTKETARNESEDDRNSCDSDSGDEPILKRKILPMNGMRKEHMVNSDEEELSAKENSDSEEDLARKKLLKDKNKYKNSSDDEDVKPSTSKRNLRNKKRGEAYITPRVCHVSTDESNSTSESDDDFVPVKKKKRKATKVVNSDSDIQELSKSSNSDSDDSLLELKSKKKRKKSSSDSGSETKKSKKTRKRVKILSDSDDSSSSRKSKKQKNKKGIVDEVDIVSGSDEDEKSAEQTKGRKHIRKVLSSKDLQEATKKAAEEEESRKKRLTEKQAQYNDLFVIPETETVESLVLDFDPKTKEPLVSVDSNIAKKLKPHQVEGVRFMWDAVFETVERYKSENSQGGGCILAHCMGLGKTLQTIAFVHSVMTSKELNIKTVLVLCPLNTVTNWSNEFKMWQRDAEEKVYVHKLYDEKTVDGKVDSLGCWNRRGGVGILHYDCFRTLVLGKKFKRKKSKEIIQKCLTDPGPDLVIADEGHIFKNSKSKMAEAVYKIRTLRRVVLTGTPLQNNLTEYHCMMQFVKPNLLGSKKEFQNRFVNPITNGQHKDSTTRDVKIMKRRAHVLHKLLDGCVQRKDFTVLLPYLPPKYEYVVLVKMTDIQKKMYMHYLDSIKADTDVKDLLKGGQLLKHYAHLAKIWCHPYALEMKSANYNNGDDESTSSMGSLKDFIDDKSSDESSSSASEIDWLDSQENIIKSKEKKKANVKTENGVAEADADASPAPELSTKEIMDGSDWWSKFFKNKDEMQAIEHSSKLAVLLEILKTSSSIQDKVLIFSQFLYSLDIIESFLEDLDQKAREKSKKEQQTFPPTNSNVERWRKNIEYFRIDGSTKTADRQKNCDVFNNSQLSRARLFLISTKAGGLGINLIGANRVILFDASWNPSQDMQSIFRVFRFGQTKPCYIYRLLAKGTIEEKVYNRQVVKLSLSGRVVDEHQIERHFTFEDIAQMYEFDQEDKEQPTPAVPKDRLLADLLISQKDKIYNYLEHDSLLQNQLDEGLTEEERKAAWDEYQNESSARENYQKNVEIAKADASVYDKMRMKIRDMFPELDTHLVGFYAKQVQDEIQDLRKLTNQYHQTIKDSLYYDEAKKAEWVNLLTQKKSQIANYFQHPTLLRSKMEPVLQRMRQNSMIMAQNRAQNLAQNTAISNQFRMLYGNGNLPQNYFNETHGNPYYSDQMAGTSNIQMQHPLNQTVSSANDTDGPIRLRPLPNLLEMEPEQISNTSMPYMSYAANPSAVSNLLRRNIPTTTVPYQTPHSTALPDMVELE